MTLSIPPGFDPDSNDWTQDAYNDVSDIANDNGWASWRDVLLNFDDYDWDAPQFGDGHRVGAYGSPQEAVRAMNDAGLDDIAHIWWDEDTDAYYIYVDGSE